MRPRNQPPIQQDSGQDSPSDGNEHRHFSRLERKRATDRKAQKLSRERAKAYVTHLERTIEQLSTPAAAGDTSLALTRRLKEQYDEIARLHGTIKYINCLTQGFNSKSGAQAVNAEPNIVLGPDSACVDPALEDADEEGDDRYLEVLGWGPGKSTPKPWPQYLNRFEIETSFETLTMNGYTLPLRTLICQNGDRNYFDTINNALVFIESSKEQTSFNTVQEDDDIAIRAVLHGWSTVKSRYTLDPAWKLLFGIDQGLFRRSGPVERMAILRSMRCILMSTIQPTEQLRRPLPSYMIPTPLQSSRPHSRLIDFFAWPDLRNQMLAHGKMFVTEKEATHFARDFRFSWPYEVYNVCIHERLSDRYSFSMEFDLAYNDIQSWQVLSSWVPRVPPFSHEYFAKPAEYAVNGEANLQSDYPELGKIRSKQDPRTQAGSYLDELVISINEPVVLPSQPIADYPTCTLAAHELLPPYSATETWDLGHACQSWP